MTNGNSRLGPDASKHFELMFNQIVNLTRADRTCLTGLA